MRPYIISLQELDEMLPSGHSIFLVDLLFPNLLLLK